eukprot:m.28118 g.28118  ORF g.28118 m.28118 type:complete len:336 (-) comp11993_c0_seq1:425-1432(-)
MAASSRGVGCLRSLAFMRPSSARSANMSGRRLFHPHSSYAHSSAFSLTRSCTRTDTHTPTPIRPRLGSSSQTAPALCQGSGCAARPLSSSAQNRSDADAGASVAVWVPKPLAKERRRLEWERKESVELEELARTGQLEIPLVNAHDLDYAAWAENCEHKRIRNMASHFCLYGDLFGDKTAWYPSARITASYPEYPVHRGNRIPIEATALPPTVRFEHRPDNAHALTPPDQKWTLALVTPDGRGVDTSPNTVKIHWLIENLEAGADVNAMPAAVPYTAVAPHVGAGAYRYVFCLLAQTQDVSLDSFDPSSVDFPTFLSEHGMTPVSLAFFQSAATE